MREIIERFFVQVKYLQERGQKGEIAYLVCGGLIMRTVSESGAGLSDNFQIMYGEYMGSAAVIHVSDAV